MPREVVRLAGKRRNCIENPNGRASPEAGDNDRLGSNHLTF